MSDDNYPIYPLKFVTGDTKRFKVLVQDPDPDSPDPDNPIMIPRNLTDWTAAAQIRKKKLDPILIASLVVVNVLGEDGFIHLHLPPIASRAVTRDGVWDLELTDPYGDVETILGGPVLPEGDVTRV